MSAAQRPLATRAVRERPPRNLPASLTAVALAAAVTALGAATVRRVQAPADTAAVVKAADAFLGTLDAGARAKAQIELNAKTRTVWSNLPSGIAMQVGAKERNGLKIGDMTPPQEKAALALLSTALSKDGYQKVMQIVDADELLEQRSAPARAPTQAIRFGRKEFYVAILGKPSTTDTWMLQFGGHHLAVNVTLAGRASVLTPTHTGAQPATYSIDGRSIRPLGDENDKALALINSLGAEQQKAATIGATVRNLVLGPGEDGKMIAPEGAKASTFTAAQKAALIDLAGEWVNIVGDAAAAAKMADVKSNIDDTYFAWAGPTTAGSGMYFRIQGPTVFIEYATQGNASPPDHIHTIYRDPTNDYAAKAAR
jgi:hypothetical protein